MALHRLLNILKADESIQADVSILTVPPTQRISFRDVAHRVVYYNHSNKFFYRIFERITKINLPYKKLLNTIRRYDAVIFNSVSSLFHFKQEELERIKKSILFLYEMPVAIQCILGNSGMEKLRSISVICTPTLILKKHLINQGISESSIHIVNQCLDEEVISAQPSKEGKADDYFTVGMIGSNSWAKSAEYFLCIAKVFVQKYPQIKVRFVWKGIQKGTNAYHIYNSDIEKAGLRDYIYFEGHTEGIADFYNDIHVLALPSREDTYPFVMLEAALFQKPTISFEESGGAVSFIRAWGGFVVPFLDFEQYADALYAYAIDGQLLEMHGEAARNYTVEQHCNAYLIREQFNHALGVIPKLTTQELT